MKTRIVFSLLLTFLVVRAFSQDFNPLYLSGTINADPENIDILMIIETEKGNFTAGLYIPDQFVYNMSTSKVVMTKDSLIVKFTGLAEYAGVWSDEFNGYKGAWKQGKEAYTTDLKSVDKTEADFVERPQTPKPPFSYVEKEILVENEKGNSVLAGTLTLPDTIGTYPLVIMITGSGAQNRNEEIAGHCPFMVIADYFAKNGIAVFRYDDRGIAESKGNLSTATTEDFMYDAIAVVRYFDDYPNINSDKTGVIGHSEGGLIAMMLAAKFPKDIDFIISMAGPGVPMKELLAQQMKDISIAEGLDSTSVEILSEMQTKILDIPEKSKTQADMRNLLTVVYDEYGQKFSEDLRDEYGLNSKGINTAVMQFSNPWMKYFLTIDPEVYLKKIKCPVLAINGSKDIQVKAGPNLKAIENCLSNGKCKYYVIQELDGLNHLFQQAELGTVSEYFRLKQTISEEPLLLMKDFILKF